MWTTSGSRGSTVVRTMPLEGPARPGQTTMPRLRQNQDLATGQRPVRTLLPHLSRLRSPCAVEGTADVFTLSPPPRA